MLQSTQKPAEDLSLAFAAAMELVQTANAQPQPIYRESFIRAMLENLRDGVIFLDSNRQIVLWNRTIELMTDIGSIRMVGNQFTPQLLSMRSLDGQEIEIESCPLEQCFRSGHTSKGEFRIAGRSGREIKVEMIVTPVIAEQGTLEGAVAVVHDASLQSDLTRQLKDLFEISMVDPLTNLHNRTEFDRVLDQFIQAKCVSDFQCSLIVCDIDYFKAINDNYNHHIGDQCLIAFAEILKQFVRSNDLVARLGGEEFVILCGNCDLRSAAERAEQIRQKLNQTAIPVLDGKCITASFGVAELQIRENGKDFFVRADSAMLKAKELGRNRVVESGESNFQPSGSTQDRRNSSVVGLIWSNPAPANPLLLEEFVTATPIAMLVEKIRGYISETKAAIVSVNNQYAQLKLDASDDRNPNLKCSYHVEIEFQEGKLQPPSGSERRFGENRQKTYLRVGISECKKKWFGKKTSDLSAVVMRDLRRYFMISEETAKLGVDRAVTKSTRENG